MPKFYLLVTLVFGLGAIVIWFVLLRPVETLSATGTIVGRNYREQATYWQAQSGLERGFRTPTPIPIADAWVFDIELDGGRERVAHAVNRITGDDFQQGDRVRVHYQHRGVPPFWARAYVLDMEPAE